MSHYPREIPIQTIRVRRMRNSSDIAPSPKYPHCKNHGGYNRTHGVSYHDMSREYTGVNIRNNQDVNNFIIIPGGHLRPAISEVEGLDRYHQRESPEECSQQNIPYKEPINGYATKDETGHLCNGSTSSLQVDTTSHSYAPQTPINQLHPQSTNQQSQTESKSNTNSNSTSHTNDKIPTPVSRQTGAVSQATGNGNSFEQFCAEFDQRSIIKNEIRAGKRVGFYRFILDIGRGNFSKVKLALHTLLEIEVAVKVIDRTKFDEKTRRLLSQELSNMEKLNHPHIIHVYEAHEVVQRWHLVMEYAPKGELNSCLKRFGRLEEKAAKIYAAQILSALDHLHSNGVVHRDLKAENVFIVNSRYIKVGDFGFSKSVSLNAALTTFCGSPPYAAPELFIADSYTGPAVDLWALGVLIFYMVAGFLPFRADSLQKIKRLIISGEYYIPATVSAPCQTVINGLLTDSVERRFTVANVKSSEWFSGTDWEYIENYKDTSSEELNDQDVRILLKRWWQIEDTELDRALAKGPKSKLTGVYRILRDRGQKYLNSPSMPSQGYVNKKNRPKKTNSVNRNKNKSNINASKKELTTVDLRDNKTLKGKVDNEGETTTRNCCIL